MLHVVNFTARVKRSFTGRTTPGSKNNGGILPKSDATSNLSPFDFAVGSDVLKHVL